MRVYVQSLGLVGSIRVQLVLLFISALLAGLGFLQQGFAVLFVSSFMVLWAMQATKNDQTALSHYMKTAIDKKVEADNLVIDSSRAGPLQALFPLLDNLVRLNHRKLKSVHSVGDEMHYSATELAGNARNVAAYSQQQADIINTSASAATEISHSIEEVSQRIEQTRLSADEGDQLCTLSQTEMRNTQQQMANVVSSVKKTEQSLKVLEEKMVSITDMSDVIRDMAEQTNLLSLNAAIEAARAGEQGRGFNVVAEEVRRLAQTSHESASAITRQVKEVTESMVSVGEQVSDVAQSSSLSQASLASALEATEQVISSLHNVSDQISGIATASEQQTIATKEISKSMEEVAQVAGKNAIMAKENANVAEHLKGLTA
ncbi:methyl-accepting chemotaxis protein [Vibrio sp. M260118]|uniref:methyl-accepting chemotaxis protein n=1 Tax=Vibrio sp. M260118 TaxID=3020896 RepID=UPI002F4231F2